MNLLFLSYWGLEDGLTVSTVFPHLRLLQETPEIKRILFVTIERGASASRELRFAPGFVTDKITFAPLRSRQNQPLLLNKIDDFVRFPNELIALVKAHRIDVLLGRGAPAGALAYLVWKKTKTPFLVESFEPHADYMLESGVWKSYDPRYLFQRYWEKKQKQLAVGLMPVAENYRRQLVQEGVPAPRIVTVPCSVNVPDFSFDPTRRQQVRARLGINQAAPVGIYVGKFGDIYYDAEAFDLFRDAAAHFGPQFRLLVLTPNPEAEVRAKLAKVGFGPEQVFVTKAPHAEVPGYLSAADFAFATIKPAECRRFCSPIKVGEYWAAGLPVLLTEGVGDDSDIIQQEGGGAIFNLERPATVPAALQQISTLLQQPKYRVDIRELAVRHRTVARAQEAYEQLLLPLASQTA
ncbi:glycosyltransferase [Hymenobacter sp. BT186]|uniref:Glycosyltransferase n=1 Tax=Hymenobacter telluris TaxID=2816474 RepID=A0A939ETY3_9BACT|nr:glycosyltransferase [Hymenobacter telluris]MBO0357363.1 glycosyltransferase [Hymenobacter telluris]MBW3373389.1 glycosyltransferase [Hymenobacter norwichensis]